MPLVTIHSRASAASRFPHTSRPNLIFAFRAATVRPVPAAAFFRGARPAFTGAFARVETADDCPSPEASESGLVRTFSTRLGTIFSVWSSQLARTAGTKNSRFPALQPFRHQIPPVIDIAGTPIQFQRSPVVSGNFQVHRVHTQFAGYSLDKLHGAPTDSPAAALFSNIQLIDIGIAAAIFEAERNSQHQVSDVPRTLDDQPRPAVGGVAHELVENCAPPLLVEKGCPWIGLFQAPHHDHKNFGG